jgi:hypothetical protein
MEDQDTEEDVPQIRTTITFFRKKVSGKTTTIATASIDFVEAIEMKLWAAFITYLSKYNQVTFPIFE